MFLLSDFSGCDGDEHSYWRKPTQSATQSSLSRLQRTNQRLRVTVHRLRKREKAVKKVTVKQRKEFIIKELKEVINGPALNFMATQIRLAGRRKGVKYDAIVKTFALSIYHQSPKPTKCCAQFSHYLQSEH